MDIQKYLDLMSEQDRRTRGRYQLTLGSLISELEKAPPTCVVEFDNGTCPGDFDSYRGYYADLSLEPAAAPKTVQQLLQEARLALGKTFEGYKGGDFTMGADTPLWTAPWGDCGPAIMSTSVDGDRVILHTKQID